ncbi:hypothetical protein GGD81_001294 [Rhodobium orientis]|nr:DUF302 domain-containing protein [Rhodobium orientis]MBB4302267.1 hypothetical protein [Rhodobium orientis]
MLSISRGFAIVLGLVMLAAPLAASAASGLFVRQVESDFDSVAFDVNDAIVNRGYVVDYTGRIGEMLKRTEADVGADASPYVNAQMTQFCSAVLSRKAMEADPQNIAFCPYTIFYFERSDAPGTVHVGFRRLAGAETPASEAALGEINALLEEIVTEVTGE